MISKELLFEVCGTQAREYFEEEKTYKPEFYINIYELAHKCKEWAALRQWNLQSAIYMLDSTAYCELADSSFKEVFQAETEPAAIFKACQWILDNK